MLKRNGMYGIFCLMFIIFLFMNLSMGQTCDQKKELMMDAAIIGAEPNLFVQSIPNETNISCSIPSYGYLAGLAEIVAKNLSKQGKLSATPEELARELRYAGWPEKIWVLTLPPQRITVQYPGEAVEYFPIETTDRTLMTLAKDGDTPKIVQLDYFGKAAMNNRIEGGVNLDPDIVWADSGMNNITAINRFTASVQVFA